MAMEKNFNENGKLFLLLALNIFALTCTESKQLPIQSLTAREVYRLLRQTGQQDVIPEGRVITHGLAAGAGFALGLTKSLAVVMLYDIITANVTAADLALRNAAKAKANMGGGARQELCFNSRKSRNLNEANAVAESFEWLDKSEVRLNGHRRKGKSYRQRSDKRHFKAANSRQATTTEVESPTLATSPTTTTGTLPTTSDADVAAADGTGTTSPTTTDAENEAATNCVVLREP